MRNQFFILILQFMLFSGLNFAAGYDVAVLYDMSGSIQWNQQWRTAIQQANQDIISLIGDGRIADKTAWEIKYSSLFESKITDSLIEEGNYLLYLNLVKLNVKDLLSLPQNIYKNSVHRRGVSFQKFSAIGFLRTQRQMGNGHFWI